MAIYKLSDIIGFVRGNSTFQKKDLSGVGDYLGLHYGKTYKIDIIDDSFKHYVDKKFFKENQQIKNLDTLLITTSETVNELGKVVLFNSNKIGLLGGEQIKLFPKNKNTLSKKYLFYWFYRHNQILKRFATGIKVFRIKGDDLRFIYGKFPNIDQQKQIIDIIKPIEEYIIKAKRILSLINKTWVWHLQEQKIAK